MKNGLYSIHVQLGDGRDGKGSGVLTFNEGVILGGDAFLFYTGRYSAEKSTVRGEVIVHQHTPSTDQNPLFAASGGSEVGIGFSGSFTDTGATVSGTALVGRHSMIFRATLRRLASVAGAAEFSLQKGVLSPVG
jgi:carbonic anhydrase/acetyltransferase-like protein (isoleucine patch superfamily)